MKRVLLSVTLAFVVLAASTAGAQTCTGPSLLANPGFEDNGGSYDGWFVFGSGPQLSLPAGDNIIRTGAAASKIFGEFLGCPGTGAFTVGGYGQAFTPVAGKTYELTGYSYISFPDTIPGDDTCNGNRAIAKIVFFDAVSAGSELSSNEIVIGDYSSVRDTWTRFSVSAPTPAGALRVEVLFLYLQPACDEGAVYVDDTAFCEYDPPTKPTNLLANPSFSDGLNDWADFGNAAADGRAFAVRTPIAAAKVWGTFVPDSDSGMFQRLPAEPGWAYTFGGYSMTTCIEDPVTGTNDNICIGRVVFLDSQGAEIWGSDLTLMDNTAPLGTWTWHERTFGAPPGTDSVDVFILFISPSQLGGAVFLDDFCFYGVNDPTAASTPTVKGIELHQNVPNPFNPTTQISFELTQPGHVTLTVYDVSGRRIATLQNGPLDVGPHFVTWNGRTSAGLLATSGVYYYTLETSTGRLARSMVLLK